MATRRKKKAAARKRVARTGRTGASNIQNDGDVKIRRSQDLTYKFKGSTRRGTTVTVGTDGGITIGSR